MENGTAKITDVNLYACGYCENHMHLVFKGAQKEHRKFPALVALIHHVDYGYLLYDTGYSDEVFKNGFVSKLYLKLNPTTISDEDTILLQLQRDNIYPDQIKTILLSHAHPDHIGGLKFFNQYQLITTQAVADTMQKPKLFDLVFPNMLSDAQKRLTILDNSRKAETFLSDYFDCVYDIFGDQSLFGVVLDGHSKEQLGLYLPEKNLFLAADSAWGMDTLLLCEKMKSLPRKIQNDFSAYSKTTKQLLRFQSDYPHISIVFSHSNFKKDML